MSERKMKRCKSKMLSDSGYESCERTGKHVWHGYTIKYARQIIRISWRSRRPTP